MLEKIIVFAVVFGLFPAAAILFRVVTGSFKGADEFAIFSAGLIGFAGLVVVTFMFAWWVIVTPYN